jgi:hypothetical protein
VSATRSIPPSLHSATMAAIDAMPWLTPSDASLRALALRLAAAIDACGADVELLALLTPKYHAALRDLGGTPATRRELNTVEPEEDIIAELRVVR